MTRSEIVKELMAQMNNDDIVIASTGFISREVFKYDRPLNFYMMGSMGNALAIGVGLAKSLEDDGIDKRVFVINGDGSALMGLGSLVTAQSLKLDNLHHFIIDNGMHESTGGQPTASKHFNCEYIHSNTIVFDCEKDDSIPPRITLTCKEITERFKDAILRIKEQQKTS